VPYDPEPPAGGDVVRALVDEAARRSSVLWLRYGDDERARPAWHVWRDGAVFVVAEAGTRVGGGEQWLPGLADARTATVICRAQDSRARLVTWQATVRPLQPRTAEWEAAAAALRSARLNASDLAGLIDRWATTAVIVRLDPTGEVLETAARSAAAARHGSEAGRS